MEVETKSKLITCRLCLTHTSENYILNIFMAEDPLLPRKIAHNLNIEIEETDALPKTICNSCANKITDWVDFKAKCQQSMAYLREMYISKVSPVREEKSAETLDIKLIKSEKAINNELDVRPKSSASNTTSTNRKNKLKVNSKKGDSVTSSNSEDSSKSDEERNVSQMLGTTNEYTCEICSEKRSNIFDFLDHQRTHDGCPVFKCNPCGKVFVTRNELVAHDQTHRVSCPQCAKLVLPRSLRAHLVAHTDAFKCTQCPARFSNRCNLASHVIVTHTDIKEHVCENCGKSFGTKTSLRTHLKSHSDVRMYPCQLCSYSGRTASALYIHKSKHEGVARVCEICAKSFKSNRYLKDHMRRCHTSKKPHECNFCEKRFVDKYMLTVHVRTHTGIRPYTCTVCERAFSRSDGLKEHMVTHDHRACYYCERCGKSFIYKRSLGRHSCNNAI